MSKISKIGVVGAGNMGSGIAQKIAQEGLDVVMVDTGEEWVKRGMDNIERLLREGAERKIFHPDDIGRIMSRITGTTDLQALADADLVIEAVFEDKGVKTDLFKKLDAICMEKTILATNTSSFYVREFAEATSRPDRVIGLLYAKNITPKLVINRIVPEMVARGDMLSHEDVVEVLSVDLLGLVPVDDQVVVSTNTGGHLIMNKDSRAGAAFKRIAMRLNGRPDLPIEVPYAKQGFWKKVGKVLTKNVI